MARLAPSSPIVLPFWLPLQTRFPIPSATEAPLTSLPHQPGGHPPRHQKDPDSRARHDVILLRKQYTKAFGSIPNESASSSILIRFNPGEPPLDGSGSRFQGERAEREARAERVHSQTDRLTERQSQGEAGEWDRDDKSGG